MPPRKKNIVVNEIIEQMSENVVEQSTEPVEKTRGKREKKSTKHKVVAVVTPEGIQGVFQPEIRRPLIAHLPVHTSDIQFHDQIFTYDPKPPVPFEAFDAGDIDPFSSEAMYENVPREKKKEEQGQEQEPENNTIIHTLETFEPVPVQPSVSIPQQPAGRKEYGPTTLLVHYAKTKSTRELPSESSVACFWCCESFKGRPCIIPSHIIDDTWQVYGNFCTPQCAMAYLLSELLDTHTRWERIALLNRLYAETCSGRLYPAPSRESLERFGGPISAEEFRAMCERQKTRVDIHMPPMVSILASMDTKPIDFYETPLRNTFASPYQFQVNRMTDEPKSLKLKRNKPLKDKESTLDSCLQLTVKS